MVQSKSASERSIMRTVNTTTRMSGRVTEWKDNYGFIRCTDGRILFVHFSSIGASGFRTLVPGDRVAFEIVQTAKGPQAVNVTLFID